MRNDELRLRVPANHPECCRLKHIIIEAIPGKGNFWRFVPNMVIREQYLEEEGTFPRLGNITGLETRCGLRVGYVG